MVKITNLVDLPKKSGLYKVLDGQGTILYIGQSSNIHARWNSGHHKLSDILQRCGTEVWVDWVLLPSWLLNRAEFAAVQFHRPLLNQKMPPIV